MSLSRYLFLTFTWGWFLLDVQSHKQSDDAELVEGGQGPVMFIDPAIGATDNDDDEDEE